MRTRLTAALVGMAIALPLTLAAASASTVATASTSTFKVVADAAVDQSRPKTNFGRGDLRADQSPVVRSYVRFAVGALSGPVTKATLSLYTRNANPAGFNVSGVPGAAWKESAITWATAPLPGPVVASSGPLPAGRWVAVDVTGLVAGTGSVTMALSSTSSTASAYASRESGANAPRLMVETTVPTTTTTTTAPPTTTTTTQPSAGGCPSSSFTPGQARSNLLGYLWADGHLSGGTFNLYVSTTCQARRVAADVATLGLAATTTADSTGTHFHIKATSPFDHEWLDGVPAETAAGVAADDDLRYFLAAVIEGEGSGSGKVLDDPSWGRTAGLVSLYGRLGVVVKPDHPAPSCGCSSDPRFWNTYVDPAANTTVYNGYVAMIRSWPFAELGRVPKPR